MDKISAKDFKDIEKELPDLPQVKKPQRLEAWENMTDEKFNELMNKLDNPVDFQKELAVKLKIFLDGQMEMEMGQLGMLTSKTQSWIHTFNDTLEKIQRSIHGTKKVNVNVNVTHSQIAAKIRQHNNKDAIDVPVKEDSQ